MKIIFQGKCAPVNCIKAEIKYFDENSLVKNYTQYTGYASAPCNIYCEVCSANDSVIFLNSCGGKRLSDKHLKHLKDIFNLTKNDFIMIHNNDMIKSRILNKDTLICFEENVLFHSSVAASIAELGDNIENAKSSDEVVTLVKNYILFWKEQNMK